MDWGCPASLKHHWEQIKANGNFFSLSPPYQILHTCWDIPALLAIFTAFQVSGSAWISWCPVPTSTQTSPAPEMLAWSALHGWGHPAAFIFCNHSYVTANSSFLIHTHLLVVKAKPQPHYFNLQLLNHFKELTREPPTWCQQAAGSRDGKCWEGMRNINQEVTPFGFRWPYTPPGRASFCTIYTEVGESVEKWLFL